MNAPLSSLALIHPQWDAPAIVRAVSTTRCGGVSKTPYNDGQATGGTEAAGGGLNLGGACGDAHADVQSNRLLLAQHLGVAPFWLSQEHGTHVVNADDHVGPVAEPPAVRPAPVADAAITTRSDIALAILCADCLPVVFATHDIVAAAHAGWRGLAGGVLQNTVQAMVAQGAAVDQISAWLGPAIGPSAFEVGEDVRDAFCSANAACEVHFNAYPGRQNKWHADLYGLARTALAQQGVARIFGGDCCTVNDPLRFFSYRRDRRTGRMATLIWMEPS